MKKIDDIYAHFKTFLNDNYDPVIIFDKYKYPLGSALVKLDPILFNSACLAYFDSLIKDGSVYLLDGYYYEV